tara:strand:- start:888 stop:1121 length:234 start_codon:yes stop_codon:yes gene_type:complete
MALILRKDYKQTTGGQYMSAHSGHTWTKKTIASTVNWVDTLGNCWTANFLTEEDQDRFTTQDTVQVLSIKFREDPYA